MATCGMALRRSSAVLALVVALVASACGSSRYEFVSNKQLGIYLKVPDHWQEVPQDALLPLYGQGGKEPSPEGFALLKQVLWERAWDSSATPAVEHFALGGADAPVVRVNVRSLQPDERRAVSVDALRNLLLGAYQEELEGFQELIRSPGTSDIVSADFIPLQDQDLAPEGFFGVRQLFEARTEGDALYVVGFVALVDVGRTRLSTITVHCNRRCFAANEQQITTVLDSFTVRK